jgi:Tfp pilus assembly protein PilV
MKNLNFKVIQNRGFGLLEVVLAIAVFAFGMLALVQLQTNMARSGADANSRTVAANLAEDLIERARGFTQMAADADNGRMDYNEIVNVTNTQTRAGLNYTVNLIVDDFYWDAGSESFTETQPTGIVNSDIKRMDIAVVWRPLEDGESFEDHDSIDYEAGGALRIIETVSSAPGLLGALVSASKQNDGGPLVEYNPGENPDIVKLLLSNDGTEKKFKEATSPTPDVIRDDKVETWFDVVTYSQAVCQDGVDCDDAAIFLRREEFVAITCECDLETSPSEANYGLPPTLWNGVSYSERDPVFKPIGTVPNGVQQSDYCTVCCRDHHDGAATGKENVYNTNLATGGSDHPHFDLDRQGNPLDEPAGDGDRYVEACRLVRKDGFMRVTQDANQGTIIGFPEGYLEFDEGAVAYSDYVVDAVVEYYAESPVGNDQTQPLTQPGIDEFPARNPEGEGTDLPTAILPGISQQLRSRAVYLDYLTAAAKQAIDDCFPTKTENCPAPAASSPLELYPFFDLQMTWLARWTNESDNPSLMTLTNEPIQTGNLHDRGVAELAGDAVDGDGMGEQIARITSNRGNPGLTGSGAIDHSEDILGVVTTDNLYVDINGNGDPLPPIGYVVSGTLSSSVKRKPASDVRLTANPDFVMCGQTDFAWKCVIADTAPLDQRKITVSNYFLGNVDMYACSTLTMVGETSGDSGLTLTRTFQLPAGASTDIDIWVTDDSSCASF